MIRPPSDHVPQSPGAAPLPRPSSDRAAGTKAVWSCLRPGCRQPSAYRGGSDRDLGSGLALGLSIPGTVGHFRPLIGPAMCAIHWDPSHPDPEPGVHPEGFIRPSPWLAGPARIGGACSLRAALPFQTWPAVTGQPFPPRAEDSDNPGHSGCRGAGVSPTGGAVFWVTEPRAPRLVAVLLIRTRSGHSRCASVSGAQSKGVPSSLAKSSHGDPAPVERGRAPWYQSSHLDQG